MPPVASLALLLLLYHPGMRTPSSSQPTERALFTDDFERDLSRWDVIGRNAVAIGASGDSRHGSVLTLTPNGDVAATIRGSEAWGPVRVEGEMMFPSPEDNYLGFVYNFTTRGTRRDFGLIYVKGNESYLQVNPHRDFNVSRLIYPEFHIPLGGTSAVITGAWQRFALEVAGSAAHVYVGGTSTPQVTFSFLELDRGAIGFQPRSVGAPVWVDNVVARSIPRLSYSGPAIPARAYALGSLITAWEVAGPFEQTHDRVATEPTSATWSTFSADARGAVVTGRVVDYHGPRTVAYFRTTVESTAGKQAELRLGTADDLAVWLNGDFVSFVARQEAAWFDFDTNTAHPSRRVPLRLRAGHNALVLRVRGGIYATGGFFARIVDRDGCPCDF